MYSPKLDEDLVKQFYWIGQRLKKPMTHVVNSILKIVLRHYNVDIKDGNVTLTKKLEEE